MKTCRACFAEIVKHDKDCAACGSTQIIRTTAGPKTLRKYAAHARLLAGMQAAPCVCGCRGPHECTRTVEWKADTLALLSARQT